MFGDVEETGLKKVIRAKKRLDKKRPFAASSLTMEEFSKKYWMDGVVPYQYHSMGIEDGKTEVEQLTYNNIRALKNETVRLRRMMMEISAKKQEQIEEIKRDLAHTTKIYKGFMICAIVIAFISIKRKRKTYC